MSNSTVFNESLLFDNKLELQEIVPSAEKKSYISTDLVAGQIVGATSGSEYRRLYIRKLYEKLIYGCRMSDSVNSIIVRCSEGVVDRDIQILCYGKLNGGDTILRTGGELIASGKFDRKNRFIAKNIKVNRSEIEIKMELADILVFLIPVLMLVLILLWNPILEGLSILGNKIFSLATPFLGGMAGTMHIIKRKSHFYIPFRHRLKMGAFVGIVLAVLFALVIH